MKYHFLPTRTKSVSSGTSGDHFRWRSTLKNSLAVPQKVKIGLLCTTANSSQVNISKRKNTQIHIKTGTQMFIAEWQKVKPEMPISEWINKYNEVSHTMSYYSATGRNKAVTCAETRMTWNTHLVKAPKKATMSYDSIYTKCPEKVTPWRQKYSCLGESDQQLLTNTGFFSGLENVKLDGEVGCRTMWLYQKSLYHTLEKVDLSVHLIICHVIIVSQ